MTKKEIMAELTKKGVDFAKSATKATLEALLPEGKKESKNPYKKYIGKKNNDGEKITAINPKTLPGRSEKFVEVRTLHGNNTIIKEEELKDIIKK